MLYGKKHVNFDSYLAVTWNLDTTMQHIYIWWTRQRQGMGKGKLDTMFNNGNNKVKVTAVCDFHSNIVSQVFQSKEI